MPIKFVKKEDPSKVVVIENDNGKFKVIDKIEIPDWLKKKIEEEECQELKSTE